MRGRRSSIHGSDRGFALVISVSLMVLLSLLALGMLSLASIELRRSGSSDARAKATANARMGLMMALDRLQSTAGDDRRVTADASILDENSPNAHAVGVWKGWSGALAEKTAAGTPLSLDRLYTSEKGQAGFVGWLVSAKDEAATDLIDWHKSAPPTDETRFARLFTSKGSGFDLGGEKLSTYDDEQRSDGSYAWAITQENTKARLNIGVDEEQRVEKDAVLHASSRPNVSNSSLLKQPADDQWEKRAARLTGISQVGLDSDYGIAGADAAQVSRDFTVHAQSVLSNGVDGGLKADLSTGFELADADYIAETWSDAFGKVDNPFMAHGRSDWGYMRGYENQAVLYQPVRRVTTAQAEAYMNFTNADVNHTFQINGVPTMDMLRAHYRTYRHLYLADGAVTAYERPFSHVAIPSASLQDRLKTSGAPRTQPSLLPVLNRVNLEFSVMGIAPDNTPGILISPFVTIWNPHNVDLELEGLVVYPWIDIAVFTDWGVMSQMLGEGWRGEGRSIRPYFYLHLTETGEPYGTPGFKPLRLKAGEVRAFCLANDELTPRQINPMSHNAARRTWRMMPVSGPSHLNGSRSGGILLNQTVKYIGPLGLKLSPGSSYSLSFNFSATSYHYIMCLTDSYQIRNPGVELMAEPRSASGSLPSLPAEPNLMYYGMVHLGQNTLEGNRSDSFSSRFTYTGPNRPVRVGSMLTYHRTARQSGALAPADLMFTTNPRQPFATEYLGAGARFQTAPHYTSILQSATSSPAVMETTGNGRNAFYGASHSASSGRSHLPFFEVPRSPMLSIAAFQHCDLSSTAFGNPNQVGNSWASPYLPATSVSRIVRNSASGQAITPAMGVYDTSYLANESLFDDFFFSGAAPEFTRLSGRGRAEVWESDQITETKRIDDVLEDFFEDPTEHPLLNPRMSPYFGRYSPEEVQERLAGPARAARIAAHLLYDGGFNVNSTSIEAWTALLSSLRGVDPGSSNNNLQPRFRHTTPEMKENDVWAGFRSLSDAEIRTLASYLVDEIRVRGPFLSLAEFVNRRISSNRNLNNTGALQAAINRSRLNNNANQSSFNTTPYPNRENLPMANTGMNIPGWLSQADVLTHLAPSLTARSDTFVIRSQGEALGPDGKVLATVMLEAVVQRVPSWVDPADDPATRINELGSEANKKFGRRFEILSVREIVENESGDPV